MKSPFSPSLFGVGPFFLDVPLVRCHYHQVPLESCYEHIIRKEKNMGTKKGFAFIKFGLNKHKFLGVGSIGQRYNYKGICAK